MERSDAVFAGSVALVGTVIRVARDRSGATIIDYGLLAGLVGLAAFAGFVLTGTAVADMFNAISTVFNASLQPSP